jgi:hypothetical protein
MLFDGPADLPTATLRSRANAARHRVIAADLAGWLATRWRWLRPRTVPLLVAFIGMLAVLGATKYLTAYAGGDQEIRAAVHGARPHASSDAQDPAAVVRGGHRCEAPVELTPAPAAAHR